MKKILALTLSSLLIAVPAFAVNTAITYNSGILVGLFLGFCSLIVVVQVIPSAIIFLGFMKAVFSKTSKSKIKS